MNFDYRVSGGSQITPVARYAYYPFGWHPSAPTTTSALGVISISRTTFDCVLAYDTRITFKITGSVANLLKMKKKTVFSLSLSTIPYVTH
jgi:hypothetical protein